METIKRKPGPAKGTPAAGHRPAAVGTIEQAALAARWHLFPASHRPPAKDMAAALGVHRDTLARKMREAGRGLTDAQLAAGNALLDQAAPWVQSPPPDTLPTQEDINGSL